MSILIPSTEQTRVTPIDEIRQLAVGRLRSLMQRLSDKERAAHDVDNLRTLFESLPLASGEFGLAVNRLQNAQRYLRSDEIGAARYELRLLLMTVLVSNQG